MNKHTPGPWKDAEIANACLIVAALEMYELLNKIRAHIDSTCRECESKAIVPEIDALLDKIEGGNRGKRIRGMTRL